MKPTGARCAILGATGYIGQHFARLLAQHPWFGPPRLIASPRTAGRTLAELWELAEPPPERLALAPVESASPARLAREGIRLVFSALPSGVAGPFEADCLRRGISVFSNASDHRFGARMPLLVPEVNPDHLAIAPRTGRPILVTNPNCTATGLVVAMRPIVSLLRPRTVHVATYQALSGAGLPGLSSMSMTDNVIPFIAQEEEKVARESTRLLGELRGGRVRSLGVPFLANCARVGVRDGHLEAVTVEATGSPTGSELLSAWREFDPLRGMGLPTAPSPPVLLREEADRPQPRRDLWAGSPTAARGMAVVVGRVRWDPPYLRFFLLSHNAVRGGAGGSVLNAEWAAVKGRLPGYGPEAGA
ncbi:MAG: aspartate-semialdehyde dehydrogenase [Thermoplasmata archaeon]|nr:aspartate-semialdehyde dehydrogenase [Thermoplasmata archaeon]